MDHEKARKPGGPAGRENEMDGNPSLPCRAQAVNTGNPRLWRAFRKFNRNFKRIGRLQEENAALLEEMRRLQGGRHEGRAETLRSREEVGA